MVHKGIEFNLRLFEICLSPHIPKKSILPQKEQSITVSMPLATSDREVKAVSLNDPKGPPSARWSQTRPEQPGFGAKSPKFSMGWGMKVGTFDEYLMKMDES